MSDTTPIDDKEIRGRFSYSDYARRYDRIYNAEANAQAITEQAAQSARRKALNAQKR